MTASRAELNTIRADRTKLEAALRKAGAEVNGRPVLKCPFHEDEHASAGIHQKGETWYFTCHACDWNNGKRTGDVVDVLRRVRGLTFPEACAALGVASEPPPEIRARHLPAAPLNANEPEGVPEGAEPEIDVAAVSAASADRLHADPAALEKLWRTRAVDPATARRFNVGISADRRYWTFPVQDGGRVVALKHHRADPSAEPKCFWTPKGTDSRRLWPRHLEPTGPVWLSAGELKALSVAAAGRAAVGITGGETVDLPEGVAELLAGRPVAIVPDNDATGRTWASKVQATLTAAGLECRVVELRTPAAAPHEDIGDWLVQEAVENAREPSAVGASLDHAWELADPWRKYTLAAIWADPSTWRPVEHVPTGLTLLDVGLNGGLRVGGVHVLTGKTGRTKTQTAIQLAVNAATAGFPAGIISLELPRRDVGQLVAANLADVPRAWIDKGTVHGEAGARLSAILREPGGLQLTIIDDDEPAPIGRERLAALIAEGCRRSGWRLAVLDYMGLLAREDDEAEYTADLQNSAAIKRIARAQNIALVVLVEVRKFGRGDKAPVNIDDVLGAGRVVYDATTVFNVDCEQTGGGLGAPPIGLVKLRPLKTRYSALGSQGDELCFRWHPGTGRVCNLEESEPLLTGGEG